MLSVRSFLFPERRFVCFQTGHAFAAGCFDERDKTVLDLGLLGVPLDLQKGGWQTFALESHLEVAQSSWTYHY